MTLRYAMRLCIVLPILGLAVAGSAAAQAPAKKLYCWDEAGVRVCGDALPPEVVDRARVEINAKSGLRSGEVQRALTAEEQAAAAAAAQQTLADAEAEAARKRQDLAMAESYDTEADLRRAYGERIALVEESLKTSRLGLINLRQSLLSLLRKAAELELQSKPVDAALLDSIRQQHNDLLRQDEVLQQQLRDYASLDNDLLKALDRYRALKAPHKASEEVTPGG